VTHFVGSRFGQDSAPRIATSAALLLESSELPPEPMYQPLIPFVSGVSGAGGITSGAAASNPPSGTPTWKKFPDRLDLYAYQGDDIQIPLYFQDPSDPTLDMSGYDWYGQTRLLHTYRSTLVNDLTISAEYIPPDPDVPGSGSTLVTLFLPRVHNRVIGTYHWDLYTLSPFVGPDFPKPEDIADEDWPPTDQIKTWVFGFLYIVPRVTDTGYLTLPATAVQTGELVIVTPTGTYGPNGRVP
jgi:hypothetical protein